MTPRTGARGGGCGVGRAGPATRVLGRGGAVFSHENFSTTLHHKPHGRSQFSQVFVLKCHPVAGQEAEGMGGCRSSGSMWAASSRQPPHGPGLPHACICPPPRGWVEGTSQRPAGRPLTFWKGAGGKGRWGLASTREVFPSQTRGQPLPPVG